MYYFYEITINTMNTYAFFNIAFLAQYKIISYLTLPEPV